MKSAVSAFTTGVLVLSVAGGGAHASQGSASVAGISVQYTVDDVARFDGPGCARVWWEARYTSPAYRSFSINVELAQRGSNSPDTDYESVYTMWDAESGTVSGALCVTDYDFDPSNGPAVFSGSVEVEASSSNAAESADLPASVLPIRQNRARFNSLRVRPRSGSKWSGKWGSIRGKVTAKTVTEGRLGADGTVSVDVKIRGKWRHVMNLHPNEFGRFASGGEFYEIRPIPRGARVRARLTECGWCTGARRTVRAR